MGEPPPGARAAKEGKRDMIDDRGDEVVGRRCAHRSPMDSSRIEQHKQAKQRVERAESRANSDRIFSRIESDSSVESGDYEHSKF